MMNLGTQPIFPLFPPGGVAIDDGDKYHLLGLYSGISLSIPVVAIDAYHSIRSIIQEYSAGALSTITNNGVGMLSSIEESKGLASIIQLRGKGVTSTIDETGQSVESTI